MNNYSSVKSVKGGFNLEFRSDRKSNHSLVTSVTVEGAEKLVEQLRKRLAKSPRYFIVGPTTKQQGDGDTL